jgi:hypothetical protein
MKSSPLRRACVAATVVALASVSLSAAPAHAAFEGGIRIDVSVHDRSGGDCTTTPAVDGDAPAIVDNGVAVTRSHTFTGTNVANGFPGDVTNLSASGTVRATASPAGNRLMTFKGNASAAARAVPVIGDTSTCSTEVTAMAAAEAGFDLPAPMWASVSVSGKGDGILQAIVGSDVTATGTIVAEGTGGAAGYVEAGDTSILVAAQARAYTDGPLTAETTAQSGTFSITLSPMGYSAAATGAGKAYVGLGARSCSTHRISGALTWRVSKVRTVTINVNGARKITFTGGAVRKRSFQLAVPSRSKAKVVATVVLDNGKRVTATRSFLACSR